MKKHENDEEFIPTIAEWGKLYNTWGRKIAKVRGLVDNVCRTHGVSSRNRNAFVRYVLDEMPTAAVAVEVLGARLID